MLFKTLCRSVVSVLLALLMCKVLCSDYVYHLDSLRYLENDFILVEAKLTVPCSYVFRKVPYKYIVFKPKRKDSKEKEKYLWDYLVGWGAMKNRCLQIPKDRCKAGGILCISFCSYFNIWCTHNCCLLCT